MKLNGEPTNNPFDKDVNNAGTSASSSPYENTNPYASNVPTASPVPPEPVQSYPYQVPPAPLPTPPQYQQQNPYQQNPYQNAPYQQGLQQPNPYNAAPQQAVYANYQPQRTNPFALTSFIIGLSQIMLFLLLIPGPLAVIFGHIALSQIKARNEAGSIFAIIGLILGYLGIGFFLLLMLAGIADGSSNYDSDYSVYGLIQ